MMVLCTKNKQQCSFKPCTTAWLFTHWMMLLVVLMDMLIPANYAWVVPRRLVPFLRRNGKRSQSTSVIAMGGYYSEPQDDDDHNYKNNSNNQNGQRQHMVFGVQYVERTVNLDSYGALNLLAPLQDDYGFYGQAIHKEGVLANYILQNLQNLLAISPDSPRKPTVMIMDQTGCVSLALANAVDVRVVAASIARDTVNLQLLQATNLILHHNTAPVDIVLLPTDENTSLQSLPGADLVISTYHTDAETLWNLVNPYRGEIGTVLLFLDEHGALCTDWRERPSASGKSGDPFNTYLDSL